MATPHSSQHRHLRIDSSRVEAQHNLCDDEPVPAGHSACLESQTSSARGFGSRTRKKTREEPHGPYGSSWGLQHLNWLNFHFTVGYDPKDLSSVVLTPKLYNIEC